MFLADGFYPVTGYVPTMIYHTANEQPDKN